MKNLQHPPKIITKTNLLLLLNNSHIINNNVNNNNNININHPHPRRRIPRVFLFFLSSAILLLLLLFFDSSPASSSPASPASSLLSVMTTTTMMMTRFQSSGAVMALGRRTGGGGGGGSAPTRLIVSAAPLRIPSSISSASMLLRSSKNQHHRFYSSSRRGGGGGGGGGGSQQQQEQQQQKYNSVLYSQRRFFGSTTTTTGSSSSSDKNNNDDDSSSSNNSTQSSTTETSEEFSTTTNTNTTSDDETMSIEEVTKTTATATKPSVNTAVLQKKKSSSSRRFRQGVGDLLSAAGFISSSVLSIVRAGNPERVWKKQTQPQLQAFLDFLKASGIDLELEDTFLKSKSGASMSLALLARVHAHLYFNKNDKAEATEATATSSLQQQQHSPEFWNRARRYMRYATAVYGPAMVRAAQIDVGKSRMRDVLFGGLFGSRFLVWSNSTDNTGSTGTGFFGQKQQQQSKSNNTTTTTNNNNNNLEVLSQHIGVPAQDLLWVEVDVNYAPESDDDDDEDDDDHCLRHLVAIDHTHKEVVLAIRGTFSLQEIVVDIASYSKQFCGGEAHEGMAAMAEQLWSVAGPTIVQTLQEHPDYEFVVTGHSLGAGTASLLAVLLKQQQLQQQRNQYTSNTLLPPDTSLRCFAYASPPVFTPLEFIPQATQVITNFIHEADVVPFLSVYSVRHLMADLRAIQSATSGLSWVQKLAIVSGSQPLPEDLIDAVVQSSSRPMLVPKQGAPRLKVPAGETIWLLRSILSNDDDDDGYYYTPHIYRDRIFPFPYIRVNPDMLMDHLPARYEYALEHLDLHGGDNDDDDDDGTGNNND